jgi:transcriptional regulator with GAF, ATPase, and Fis domain
MPRILWVQKDGQLADKESVEALTGVKVAVASGPPSTWKNLARQIQVVVLELPLDREILAHTLTEAQGAENASSIVIYDANRELDESLISPTMMFHHIAVRLTVEELAAALAAVLEEVVSLPAVSSKRGQWEAMLIGESAVMQELRAMIRLVGPRQSTVLITGETGTGKELVARAVHMASKRSGEDMVAVNCAAIPENLVEAELFGHAKGAFTSAVNHRVGLFEQAHRGTIFLDEIGELPMEVQPKLLRVIQEREVQRVGSSETIQLDTRVIAATNIDLEWAVEQKKFREDLLYRLNVVPIRVPPLRSHASDIPHLVEHFTEKICSREGFRPKTVSSSAMDRLAAYHWPGNVRQLEHAIERAVSLAANRERLYLGDFQLPAPAMDLSRGALPEDALTSGLSFEAIIGQVERLLIQEALRKCDGNKAKAARILGLKRTTMLYKSKAHLAAAS